MYKEKPFGWFYHEINEKVLIEVSNLFLRIDKALDKLIKFNWKI